MTQVFADADAVAAAAAGRIRSLASDAIARAGSFRIALSGGATPERLYRRLATTPMREAIDWSRTVVLFADERAVPPDDPASNYRRVRTLLLDPLAPACPRVARMRAEDADLDRAAREYEDELRDPLDLVVLGVGPEGHTASLFPGSPAVVERDRRCVAVEHSPKPPARRLTLTPRALSEARAVLVLVTGADKAAAVAAAFTPGATPDRCPAAMLRGREWLLDRAAAAGLE